MTRIILFHAGIIRRRLRRDSENLGASLEVKCDALNFKNYSINNRSPSEREKKGGILVGAALVTKCGISFRRIKVTWLDAEDP